MSGRHGSKRAIALILAIAMVVVSVATPSGAICTILDCLTDKTNIEVTRSGEASLELMDQGETNGFARVHQWGTVAASTKSGDLLWERQPTALIEDWGRERWSKVPPWVYMGPVAKWSNGWNAENPLIAHDFTNDGVDDVLVAHNEVRHKEDGVRGVFLQSVLTIFDGTDGSTLWFEVSMGVVPTIQLVGETVIVAEENGEPTGSISWNGEPGGLSSLRGLQFEVTSGGIQASEAWRYEPSDAGWARWTGPVPAGEKRIAAAHTPEEGHTSTLMVLDAVTGSIAWESRPGGHIEHLAYEPAEDELVYTTREIVVPGFLSPIGAGLDVDGFRIHAASAVDGTVRSSTPTETLGTPQALALGDLTGDGRAEWVVSHHPTAKGTLEVDTVRSRVTVTDGATGLPVWERSVGTSGLPAPATALDPLLPPTPVNSVSAYGLAVEEGRVLVASSIVWTNWIENWDLRAFEGATGEMAWFQAPSDALTPHSLHVDTVEEESVVFGITGDGAHRGYSLEDGTERASSAQLTQVHAAVAAHVDEDGIKELITGTRSGGVFALNTAELGIEMPPVQWKTDVDGRVQELHLADVDDDGQAELVVAAEDEIAVLDVVTGQPLVRIAYEDAYVWTVGIADVDEDGAMDLLVPTTGLDAYRGEDGAHLWRFDPQIADGTETYFSDPAVVDETVVAQYNARALGEELAKDTATGLGALLSPPTVTSEVVGLNLATGTLAWTREVAPSAGQSTSLWRGVSAAPSWPDASGHAVAVASPASAEDESGTVDILDARDGQPLPPGSFDTPGAVLGVEVGAQGQLIAYAMDGLVELTPEGGYVYEVGGNPVSANVFDVDAGSFGALGNLTVASSNSMVMFLDADTFVDGKPQTAIALAEFSGGRVLVADLEDDGTDEIVIFEHPYEALDAVWQKQGGFYKHTTAKGSGMTIVQVEDR